MKAMSFMACLLFACSANVFAGGPQASADSSLSSRFAFSGGMGVEYMSAIDIVDYVNFHAANDGAAQNVSEFMAGVSLFSALVYPLTSEWALKAEYVYFLVSINPNTIHASEFSLTVHMPSLIVQYVLWDERLYNIKVGAGLGYHFASLATKYLTVDDRLTGKGIGALIDLEANTAFGDHLFAYLGADSRWEFIGRLRNSASSTQLSNLPTGNAFSIGARLGFSYYF